MRLFIYAVRQRTLRGAAHSLAEGLTFFRFYDKLKQIKGSSRQYSASADKLSFAATYPIALRNPPEHQTARLLSLRTRRLPR
jgi:hypothetical protein